MIEKTVKTSNKTGSNFLVTNDNQHCYSSDEDNAESPYADYDFTAIQEANEEKEESEEEDNESESSNNQDIDNELSDKSFIDEDEDDKYEGFEFLHNDVVCSTQDKAGIPKTWILLDSQSTVDVFSNPRLLTNICKSKIMLMLHCNAGKAIVTKKGDLRGYGIHMGKQARKTDVICKTKNSTIWDITGSASVLVTTFGHPDIRMGFQVK